ncbi:hypothetical protein OsJ_26987 [Oryza sativa Japonica Group]|uniref:Uncharacterized protein n=1 Tax=Oryza sativa subsp. japonica TaxID=39947 RepID=B9G0G7_ORYSJ|nr:hypothetical protein OsJ_26987 [Oryza sativa Japonica Group]
MAMAMAMASRPSHSAALFCLALLLLLLHALPHASTAKVPAAANRHHRAGNATATSRRALSTGTEGWAAPSVIDLREPPPPSATTAPPPPPPRAPPGGEGCAARLRGRLTEDCFQLPHATCAVYPYDAEARAVDRASPHGGTWRTLPVVPLAAADPASASASAGDVCYVELAHLNYREGYFVRCPAFNCSHHPHVSCTEFPPSAVAAAVWEHRRTTYRDTVGPLFGRYTYDA